MRMLAEEQKTTEQSRAEGAYKAVTDKLSKKINLNLSKSGIPARTIALPGSVSVSSVFVWFCNMTKEECVPFEPKPQKLTLTISLIKAHELSRGIVEKRTKSYEKKRCVIRKWVWLFIAV